MATSKLLELVPRVRTRLLESSERFWSDAEIVAEFNAGISDLWRRINDVFEDHFLTVDTTNVTMATSATTLTGVPTDVFTVRGLEPVNVSTYSALRFEFKPYNSAEFQSARSATAFDPGQGGLIYAAVTGAGAPVGAPTIHVAPPLTATIAIRLSYVPTIAAKTLGDYNPIPGESDQALVYYAVAHLLNKDKDEFTIDRGYMGKYEEEVTKILVSVTPRQTQDDEVSEAIFEPYWV